MLSSFFRLVARNSSHQLLCRNFTRLTPKPPPPLPILPTHLRNQPNFPCCQVASAAVRTSKQLPSDSDSVQPHLAHSVDRHNLHNPLLGRISPYAEEYSIAIDTLAGEGNVAACMATLAQMQAKKIPCTRETYKTFLQAVVNYPDLKKQDPRKLAAILVEQAGIESREAQRRMIPEHLFLENRKGLNAETAWRRYDAYLVVEELRQLLLEIAIPTEHETAHLVLRILEDIAEALPEKKRKLAAPTPLFNNHERLQQIYAHDVLGNQDELEAAFMKLWDQPGMETELPFHMLASVRKDATPLQAASTAFLVFSEMEARETRWYEEIFLSLIQSLLRARNDATPEGVLAKLMPIVDDAVRRRDVNLVMSRIHDWGLGHENKGDSTTAEEKWAEGLHLSNTSDSRTAEGEWAENSHLSSISDSTTAEGKWALSNTSDSTTAEGECVDLSVKSLSRRTLPIDNRLAARKYGATIKSYIDTGICDAAQLRHILSGLDISFAKRANQDADDTARLILNITSTLSANNESLTLEEKGRQMTAWAHFGQWEKILHRVPTEMETVPLGHIEYRHLLILHLAALCRTDHADNAFELLSKLDRQKKMDITFLDVMLTSFIGKDALSNILRIYFEIIPQSKLECTRNTYAYAISALCRQQCPSVAEKVFEDMLTASVPPHRGIFRSLALGYASIDKPTMGIVMLKRMEEYGFKPVVQDYAVYFRHLVKAAAELPYPASVKKRTCRPWHLKTLSNMETVLDAYQGMMKEGPVPDSYCTEKAIAACFFLRNTRWVDEFFRYARFQNISLSPDTYHWLVNWNVQINNQEGIRKLLMMAEHEKVALRNRTHSLVIKSLCRESTDGVIKYYQTMRRQKKLKLDHVMVLQLFGILRSQGKWDLLEDLLRELREMRYIVPPSTLTHGARKIYQRSGSIINALAYINAMRSIGARMEVQTYEFLLWRFMDYACRYFPRGIKKHVPCITPVKITPQEAASTMKVLFGNMRNENLVPTPFIYRLMILSLSAVRDWEGAMEVVTLARSMKVELDNETEGIVSMLQILPNLSNWKLDIDRDSVDCKEGAVATEPSEKPLESVLAERDGDKLDDWDWSKSAIEEDEKGRKDRLASPYGE